jgi:hypothetical protein
MNNLNPRSERGAAVPGVFLFILVAALVAMAFVLGRWSAGRPQSHDKPRTELQNQVFTAATKQLDAAKVSKTWNQKQHDAFSALTSRLSTKDHLALKHQLSSLFNAGEIQFDPGLPSTESPPCPCAACPGTTSTPAPVQGKEPPAAPAAKKKAASAN